MKKNRDIRKVVLFRDFGMTQTWDTLTSDTEFRIEFRGDKARVLNDSPFTDEKASYFNKLRLLRKEVLFGVEVCKYKLIVNRRECYFTSDYVISSK